MEGGELAVEEGGGSYLVGINVFKGDGRMGSKAELELIGWMVKCCIGEEGHDGGLKWAAAAEISIL
jgi:hypothetical protein